MIFRLPMRSLNPAFWQEGTGAISFGDIVTLTRGADTPAIDILILQPHPNGGFFVADVSRAQRPISARPQHDLRPTRKILPPPSSAPTRCTTAIHREAYPQF